MQNGRFSLYPGVNTTAYSLAAGTDLSNWRSGQPYVNTNTDPARGSVNVQFSTTGSVSYTSGSGVVQRTYSDFNPPSATNTVTSTTTLNTFLLYRGTTTSADIWYQNVSVLPSTTYTVSYYASNASPVGSTGVQPQLQLQATFVNGGTVQTATTLGTATIPLEPSTDTWTQYSYTFTTASNTSNVELRLTDPVTSTATNDNQVAITGITARASSASAGTAFSCNGAFYQIRQTDNTAVNTYPGNSSRLYLVNRSSSAYTTTQLLELGATINGLSYEPNNGFMYALTYRNTTATSNTAGASREAQPSSYVEISKIGQGGIESLGFVANLPVLQWAAGTVDRGQTLYLKSQANDNIIYKLNLSASPVTVTQLALTTSAGASTNFTAYDLAFDPTSNLLYGGAQPGLLSSIDPATGIVTVISTTNTANDPLGSLFFDVSGNLYAYGNGSTTSTTANGNFYTINKSTGAATVLSSVSRATNSDGASCVNPSEQVDVVKQLASVATVSGNVNQRDVTFNLYLRNTGTVTLPNVQVSDFLWTSAASSANSINVAFPTATAGALQGTITVTNLDGSSLSANSAYTGQGTANGATTASDPSLAALLNTGTAQVLTAGQRAQITFTVRMTFPSGAVPTTVQYNSTYASNSVSSNPGTQQFTNGTLLPPDDLTAYDTSTDGTTYAPLRVNGPIDSADPTPITFYPGITGNVYEDVNYGGGAGRSRVNAGGVGRGTVTVELYDGTGNYLSNTTTDTNGNYAFTNLTAGASYTVRVVNSTVTSSRVGSTTTTGLVPVQTYRYNDVNRVGGEYPARTDAAANAGGTSASTLAALTSGTTAAESIVSVTLPTTTATATSGVDFGYNFDTVVNTNDTGQGSLRQFITNSNALGNESKLAQVYTPSSGATTALTAGTESSIFMITDGAAHAGLVAYSASTNPGLASQLTNQVAIITPATVLPPIGGASGNYYGANTSIDGTTQTRNIGDLNTTSLITGGTVGANNTALSALSGPEVQIISPATALATGLVLGSTATNGSNASVIGVSVVGFGTATNTNTDANILVASTGAIIRASAIGVLATSANGTTAPATLSNADGIRVLGTATNVTITNNLVSYNNGNGIDVVSGATGASITNNRIRTNAQSNSLLAGVNINASAASVTGNALRANAGPGIDTNGSTGSNSIANNTVLENGRSTGSTVPGTATTSVTPGIRIYGSGNTVSTNLIYDNYGAGVLVTSAATATTISQNSIYNNGNVAGFNTAATAAGGEIGIDLEGTSDNANVGTSPYVTLNSSTTTGANGLLNYPILTSATVVGTNLVLKGYAKAGAALELFLAQANPSSVNSTGANFGQGKTYLTTITEGATSSVTDADATTGVSYSGSINGFNQGSDTNANGFNFTIPLTTAQQALLTAGVKLTATSTLSSATSEFSGITNVNTAPVPNTLANVNIPNTNGATVLSPNLSGTANGTANGATNTISYYTLTSLPSSGTLTYNGTVLTSGNIATTQILPAQLNTLTYTPAAGFSGGVSFTYTATDANGVTSTTNNNNGTVSNGAATYTIPVGTADVTVSLGGQTTLNAGQPTGSFTATFTNEGPSPATNVTRTVTLPTGATVTGLQQATILTAYPNATFTTSNSVTTINFGTLTSLASTANSTVSFVFTAPTSTVASTLTATTSTANSEGNNLAPNQSSLALTTVATADVTAAITASSTATTGTFNVTFGNAGAQSAASVTRTVQLPAGLTGVTVSTSGSGETGSYNSTTGLVTYVATNSSTISSPTLAAGSTLTSAITYTITSGAAPVTATANVNTTTNEGGLTGNNSATTTMASAFDLTTTLTGPTTALSGSPTMLYITTTNLGPNAAPTATQTVSIPSAAALTNVFVPNGGTYSYNTSTNVGTVTFPALVNVPSGQTVTNTISFNAPTGSFNPSATVSTTSAGETSTSNNVAYLNGSPNGTGGTSYVTVKAATTATANEATTIAADATVVSAGTAVNYTVTATNNGPSNTANVVEKVQLLPGLTTANLKVAGTTGTLSGTTISFTTPAGTTKYDTSTGILTYPTLTSQTSGTTNTFEKLTVTTPTAVGNDGQLLATATVTNDLSDPVPADNTASVVVKVTTSADLATTISGPSSTVAGTVTSYTATFTNNGAATATSVLETVQLPTGLTNVVVSNSSNTVVTNAYNSTTGLVTLPTVASDAIGTTQSYTIAFPAPGQNYAVSSAVSSGTKDNVGTNNAAALNTTVSANSDVAISVSGPATAVVGNTVTYAVTTTNNGPTAATGVAPTLQLATGLSNVVVQAADGTTLSNAYNSSSGLVTFTSFGLAAGDSQIGLVSFTMPNASSGYVTGASAVTTTSTDAVSSNNSAAVTTSVSPTTTDAPDLSTTITTNSTSPVVAASSVTYTMNFVNNSTTTAAPVVVPVAYLPAGLSSVIIKDASGTVITNAYNSATGQVTFPTIASQPAGNTTAYTVTLTAPNNGTLAVASAVSSNDTDPTLANNYAIKSLTITAAYDVVTTLTGPATAWPGSSNVYTVTTTNNGPSTATANTTQTVTLPSGVTATNISGGGTQSGTTITFPAISSQASGTNGEVVNTFTVAMPSTGSLALTATVASANESNTANDGASLTTTQANQAPVAQNVWNTLQSSRGNTSPTGLAISPLNATDSDGTIKSYTVVTLPSNTQGVLYYSGAAVTAGQPVAASGLSFIPTAGYVGDATFTYTATDNSLAVSNLALYTIPVAQDQSTTYSIYNTNKGGATPYVTNDVLAQTIDPNTVTYDSNGLVYNATTGVLLSGAANGLATSGTNAVLASGSTLPAGTTLNAATGTISVSNASQLPRNSTATSYTVNVVTTDLNGGTNTVPVTFTIGANATPLPVVLTAFTAQAVQNRDGLLNWATASEKTNDHFDVERSLDGVSFAKIGQVAGHGTVAATSAYTFTDANIGTKVSGPAYYRLRQVDVDGTSTYSPVRSIRFTPAALVSLGLYPNPTATQTNLDLSALPAATAVRVQLLDATGRAVLSQTLAGGQVQVLDVRELAAGTYLVRVDATLPDGSLLHQALRLTKE